MGIEENKAIALSFFGLGHAPDHGAAEGAGDILHDDARFIILGIGTLNKQQFFELAGQLDTLFSGPVTMTVDTLTAEGDRVAMEARSHAKIVDGGVYENIYHLLFVIREGKIVQFTEYCDTAYAHRTLGPKLARLHEAARP
jgi:ketosteroid isomerase-like protein